MSLHSCCCWVGPSHRAWSWLYVWRFCLGHSRTLAVTIPWSEYITLEWVRMLCNSSSSVPALPVYKVVVYLIVFTLICGCAGGRIVPLPFVKVCVAARLIYFLSWNLLNAVRAFVSRVVVGCAWNKIGCWQLRCYPMVRLNCVT